ncbi:alpha-amylase [Blastomyces parvus]|uniref:alpha-amylase n=1 Tax=Blastomyces parvus TaxID=2060905 RepID=A0A2B7WWD3_9EURO|nr:alpha-amylase [Blastomyces parvus]
MISLMRYPCRLLVLFVLYHLASLSLAANTDDWRPRSIYQVFTDRFARTDGSTTAKCDAKKGFFCGGTWRGIINKLDYIQGLGFDAIMISPVSKNIEGRVSYGEAYHGYWVSDLYQLNSHFGSRDDLLELGKQLHARGMYFMVDVVINNMAVMTNSSDPTALVDYSVFKPFNDKKYFHPYCKIEDYNDYEQARNCWMGDDLVALADLNTESEEVTKMMATWVKKLVADYSIDGLRIDAAKHTGTAYLENIAKASGVFTTGEVFEGDVGITCDYQNFIPSVPNYPVYFGMIEAFTAGNISALNSKFSAAKDTCKDITALATFSENHDLPRFPSYTKDLSLAKNVLTFTILSDGIPLYYQGQEQHFSGASTPENREALWTSKYNTNSPLYKLTATLNKIRAHAIRVSPGYVRSESYPIYTDGSTIVTRKGVQGHHVLVLYSNQGEKGGNYRLDLHNTYNPGTVVTEVLSCKNYTVDHRGSVGLQLGQGLPKVIFPANQMHGSGLCGAAYHNSNNGQVSADGSVSLESGALGLRGRGMSVGVFGAALAAGFVGLL